jgi:AraC-like DNA-binding protein/ligand-binding sensor protein
MVVDPHIEPHSLVSPKKALEDIRSVYKTLAQDYKKLWGVCCVLTDAHGQRIEGESRCLECPIDAECTSLRKRAVDEALRWGEPSMLLCLKGHIAWAVPIMVNSVLIGGLVVERVIAGTESGALPPASIRQAAADLLSMAEEVNLTNAALLELRRAAALRESERAEAIHELKGQSYQSIRDVYLLEEPALIAAIKRGDRPAAREILNRVLVGIYFLGKDRPTLLKSFVLELIVTMSRSAVEAGADPAQLLGTNYSSFADLAQIDGEEELCAWLVSMLERIMDAIKGNQQYPSSVLLGAALKYMQDHLHEDLSRDAVANVACLSPSHFSRVVKQTFSHSFTELLARMRVERARELLTLTEKSLTQICFDCGFSDQSYFTKVFQKYTGRTPGEYRRSNRTFFK